MVKPKKITRCPECGGSELIIHEDRVAPATFNSGKVLINQNSWNNSEVCRIICAKPDCGFLLFDWLEKPHTMDRLKLEFT